MRTLWSLNGIRKIVGLEPALKDTFKKMWSEKELKELEIKIRYGENVWNEVKDDVILSGMKRLYTKKDIMRLVQTWNLGTPDLTGKDYLGDGWYELNSKVKYNVLNGYFTINGSGVIPRFPFIYQGLEGTYTTTYEYISGDLSEARIGVRDFANDNYMLAIELSNYKEKLINVYSNTGIEIGLLANSNSVYDNLTFKIQIEKGDTATPLNMFGGKSYDEMIDEGLITLQYNNLGDLDYMLKKDLINEEEYETYFKEIEKKEVI